MAGGRGFFVHAPRTTKHATLFSLGGRCRRWLEGQIKRQRDLVIKNSDGRERFVRQSDMHRLNAKILQTEFRAAADIELRRLRSVIRAGKAMMLVTPANVSRP